jgi:hypothetical protein
MESQEIINELKIITSEVHKKGELISPQALLDYLDALEKDAAESHKFHESQFKATCEANLEMFKSVILTGQSAIKSSILINGGAAVALLAFIGKIWTESQTQITTQLLISGLGYFVTGVLMGAFTSGFTYLSQLSYGHEHWKKGKALHAVAIISGLSAYALFGIGAWSVYGSFTTHFTP